MLVTDWIKSSSKFRRDIIKSNSGISSKSYVMVKGMQLSKLVVYWYLAMLTLERFTPYEADINWLDFSAVITSLSVFILASAWGKIKGEQSYYRRYNFDDDIKDGKEEE